MSGSAWQLLDQADGARLGLEDAWRWAQSVVCPSVLPQFGESWLHLEPTEPQLNRTAHAMLSPKSTVGAQLTERRPAGSLPAAAGSGVKQREAAEIAVCGPRLAPAGRLAQRSDACVDLRPGHV